MHTLPHDLINWECLWNHRAQSDIFVIEANGLPMGSNSEVIICNHLFYLKGGLYASLVSEVVVELFQNYLEKIFSMYYDRCFLMAILV